MENLDFPKFISFTVTNLCNLRCRMCGQWSEEGYISNRKVNPGSQMRLADWKRLVDEIANYDISFILIRGGEPFLFRGIIELVEYINGKGIFISIDSNGMLLDKYAADIVRIGNMHITFSVDGPEQIHDQVRGSQGSFQRIKKNIALLNDLEKKNDSRISKSICFTISQYSYEGLGEMPDVARKLSIESINIVPYYYYPAEIGQKYEDELKTNFECAAYSWRGFHHDSSGIDFNIFKREYRKYLKKLNGIENFPFMKFTEDDYRKWFTDSLTAVGSIACMNVEKLIDIQPNGDANFCVDFPDYPIGNVKETSIKKLWDSQKASKFRRFRRARPLSICYRCGAKYISELNG